MMTLRPSDARGDADHGWLQSKHTFSFASYLDPKHMGFRGLRVINEDRVAPGRGFGTHSHSDMEILSYVLDGALEHKDSMGTGSIIEPGDVQRMSAGRGVAHSEFNASKVAPVHFLQIWILPRERGTPPSYEQKRFEPTEKTGRLRLVASSDGRDGSVTIHADVSLYAGRFDGRETATLSLDRGRHAWVQMARGRARVNGTFLEVGDGAAFSDEREITVSDGEDAEVLVFDLA